MIPHYCDKMLWNFETAFISFISTKKKKNAVVWRWDVGRRAGLMRRKETTRNTQSTKQTTQRFLLFPNIYLVFHVRVILIGPWRIMAWLFREILSSWRRYYYPCLHVTYSDICSWKKARKVSEIWASVSVLSAMMIFCWPIGMHLSWALLECVFTLSTFAFPNIFY